MVLNVGSGTCNTEDAAGCYCLLSIIDGLDM